MRLSLRFQETSCSGRNPSFLCLEGHMANKILIPLQSLISCFLEPPANRPMAVGAIEGLWRGYSPVCLKGSIILCALVAIAQVGEGSSVLNLLCAEDQADENCEHRSGIFSRFSSRLWRGFLSTFFSLLFPPILQFLSPSMPLLTNYWAGHHLFISESCAWNRLLRLGLKPTLQELCAMFSHSVVSGWDLCLARTHSAWLQDLMKLRPDVSLQNFCERHSSRQEVGLFGFRKKHTPQGVGHHRGECNAHGMWCG